jgi:hypothetical protein
MLRRTDIFIASAALLTFGLSVYLLFSHHGDGGHPLAMGVPSMLSFVTYVRVTLAMGTR